MKTFLLICLAQLASGCTPHGVRCDGRLEPINASAATPAAASGSSARSAPGVP